MVVRSLNAELDHLGSNSSLLAVWLWVNCLTSLCFNSSSVKRVIIVPTSAVPIKIKGVNPVKCLVPEYPAQSLLNK